MKLENWAVVFDPFKAPEARRPKLGGEVYGHPTRPDGQSITTSAVSHIEGQLVVTHSGSRYELGEPAADYEAMYPNAKARVLANKVVGG